MSRVFVSHASDDKSERIKPLVRALLIEGVALWLDRPGHGDSHFNFDSAYIEHHDIVGLQAGKPFDQQILEAHWQCDAVLGCLSRRLNEQRKVLVQELVLATYADKLVTCIVDDLPYADVPSDLGLIDARRLQAPRIDSNALSRAADLIEGGDCPTPDQLPLNFLPAWQVVRQIVADIHRVTQNRRLPRLSIETAEALRTELLAVPIGPMVRPAEIPMDVIIAFGGHLDDPDQARRHLQMSMQLVLACNPEGFEPRQIIVTGGEVISPDKNPAESYWGDVLTVAGTKSRRTLAALLRAPTGLRGDRLAASSKAVIERFVGLLRSP